jgi:peroxiredoxin
MRTLKVADAREREQLLTAVGRFKAQYPHDRRLAALLTEVAGLFQRDPEQMRTMLTEASTLATDPALKGRIADDLKRVDLVGKPIELKMGGRGGRPLDLADFRGKVVLLLFFGEFSPPAAEAVVELKRRSADFPKGAVQIVGVSLDSSAEDLNNLIRRENIDWPIGWDGEGWNSPIIRGFGINRLPTAWLIDQKGTLRSLNALENPLDQVRKLLSSRGG